MLQPQLWDVGFLQLTFKLLSYLYKYDYMFSLSRLQELWTHESDGVWFMFSLHVSVAFFWFSRNKIGFHFRLKYFGGSCRETETMFKIFLQIFILKTRAGLQLEMFITYFTLTWTFPGFLGFWRILSRRAESEHDVGF